MAGCVCPCSKTELGQMEVEECFSNVLSFHHAFYHVISECIKLFKHLETIPLSFMLSDLYSTYFFPIEGKVILCEFTVLMSEFT